MLHQIMREVAVEVRAKNEVADRRFMEEVCTAIKNGKEAKNA